MTITGHCLCGAIRFEVAGEPVLLSQCHCAQCRLGAGATPVAWTTVARRAVTVRAGEPAWYRSSDHARRGFCSTCGSSLFFENARFPDELDITTACLDQADALAPTMHIWVSSKLAWARTDDGLPCHARGPGADPV
jgi:hypothetical protein